MQSDDLTNELKAQSQCIKQQITNAEKNQSGELITRPPIDDIPITVDQIAELFLPPLTAIRDKNGYIHDAATMAARCDLNHKHRYLIRDIRDQVITGCITCNTGTKTAKKIRTIFEEVLSTPFIVTEHDPIHTLFTSHILRLNINCQRYTMDPCITNFINQTIDSANFATITIGKCRSIEKIKLIIGNFLNNYPLLTEAQQMVVATFTPKDRSLKVFKPTVSEPTPYTSDLVKISPMGVSRYMKVIDSDMMLLENTTI